MNLELKDLAPFALIAPIVAFWGQIKGYLNTIRSLVIRTDTIDSRDISTTLLTKLLDKSKIVRFGDNDWDIKYEYRKSYKTYTRAAFKLEKKLFILYKGIIPIWIQHNQKEHHQFTYIVGTIHLNNLLEKTIVEENNNIVATEEEHKDKFDGYYDYRVYEDPRKSYTQDQTMPSGGNSKASNQIAITSDAYSGIAFSAQEIGKHGKYLAGWYEDLGRENNVETRSYFWTNEALELRRELKYFKEHSFWF